MVGEFGDGEEFEDDMSEHPLPALAEDPDRDRGEEPLEGCNRPYARDFSRFLTFFGADLA
jgi:hypothetical protein